MSDARIPFGDETRLKVAFDIDKDGSIQSSTPPTKLDETVNTAWRYPVDTDGNGKFDAFTLYGLYWRNPKRTNDGGVSKFERERVPLEARSIPQDTVGIGSQCRTAGLAAATAIEGSDWFKQGGNQSKAFYAYAVTIPIKELNDPSYYAPFDSSQFEPNRKADKAFAGLEYQQDRYRSGLNNTAVWTQNDLVLSPGDPFRLNGKVVTNSNLLIGGGADIKLYQVSDPFSCFYDKANAKITVGGNVVYGDLTDQPSGGSVTIDLFNGKEVAPNETATIVNGAESTDQPGSQVAYNDAAYAKRINLLKQTALSFCTDCQNTPPNAATVEGIAEYPQDLKDKFKDKLNDDNSDPYRTLADIIETYVRNITRRIPYAEIPLDQTNTAVGSYDAAGDGIDAGVFSAFLDPPDDWREPTDANTKITLNTNNLAQNDPEKQQKTTDPERAVGDRVNVGNNLPALWKKEDAGKYTAVRQPMSGVSWRDGGDRYRETQVQELEDVGQINRNGYWEIAAAANPAAPSSPYAGGGGLRAITGAGIYVDGLEADGAAYPRDGALPDKSSFLPDPNVTTSPAYDSKFVNRGAANETGDPRLNANDIPKFNALDNILVWPDLMPMSPAPLDATSKKGDLLMRATAVYHYTDDSVDPGEKDQLPIACVSSYYDPTDKNSARNPVGLPDVSGGIDTDGNGTINTLYDGTPPPAQPAADAGARSNNGVSYPFPGRSLYQAQLERQARLVFPNGRIVNQPLRDALSKDVAERGSLIVPQSMPQFVRSEFLKVLHLLDNPSRSHQGILFPGCAGSQSDR
jgi:hypothetical protein